MKKQISVLLSILILCSAALLAAPQRTPAAAEASVMRRAASLGFSEPVCDALAFHKLPGGKTMCRALIRAIRPDETGKPQPSLLHLYIVLE